jgi:hypothetical protein
MKRKSEGVITSRLVKAEQKEEGKENTVRRRQKAEERAAYFRKQ